MPPVISRKRWKDYVFLFICLTMLEQNTTKDTMIFGQKWRKLLPPLALEITHYLDWETLLWAMPNASQISRLF